MRPAAAASALPAGRAQPSNQHNSGEVSQALHQGVAKETGKRGQKKTFPDSSES